MGSWDIELPDVKIHFSVHSPEAESIMDYCTRGLLIPGEFLESFTRAPNMDAFYIHTKNRLRFMISGPEVYEWEMRRGIKHVCAPERKAIDDDA